MIHEILDEKKIIKRDSLLNIIRGMVNLNKFIEEYGINNCLSSSEFVGILSGKDHEGHSFNEARSILVTHFYPSEYYKSWKSGKNVFWINEKLDDRIIEKFVKFKVVSIVDCSKKQNDLSFMSEMLKKDKFKDIEELTICATDKNLIKNVNLSRFTKLNKLSVDFHNCPYDLSFLSNKSMESLELLNCNLTEQNVEQINKLEVKELYISGENTDNIIALVNKLKTFTSLGLKCGLQDSMIERINFGDFKNLQELDLSGNSIVNFDTFVSKYCVNLKKVNCSSNLIEFVDFSKFHKFEELNFDNNQIKNVGLAGLKPINSHCIISLDNNLMKEVNLSNIEYPRLSIYMRNNKIKKCDIKNVTLWILDLSNQPIENLNRNVLTSCNIENIDANTLNLANNLLKQIYFKNLLVLFIHIENNRFNIVECDTCSGDNMSKNCKYSDKLHILHNEKFKIIIGIKLLETFKPCFSMKYSDGCKNDKRYYCEFENQNADEELDEQLNEESDEQLDEQSNEESDEQLDEQSDEESNEQLDKWKVFKYFLYIVFGCLASYITYSIVLYFAY